MIDNLDSARYSQQHDIYIYTQDQSVVGDNVQHINTLAYVGGTKI